MKMNPKLKSVLFWILAFIVTVMISVYQRMTGPTFPVRGSEKLGEIEISYKLLRSYTENKPLPVKISISGKAEGTLMYRKYKADEEWTSVKMRFENGKLKASLPGQPRAGKLEYVVRLKNGDDSLILNEGKAAVARFKGPVPALFLIPHILVMFTSMIFGFRAGVEAWRDGNYKWMVIVTIVLLVLGGFIFGPIVQKYAFGHLWTGVPFGYDLTDNKVLLIFIFWLVAFFMSKKNRLWVVAATVLMLLVYLIPHSVLGSELDPKTGKMKNVFSAGKTTISKRL